MDESKQNRKTPLTTVSVSQEMASRLDTLLKERYPGMKRKEFLEGAIEYFERTGYDLQSDMMDFSSLEKITARLESYGDIIKEENEGRAELKQLFLDIQQKQLALPSSTDISAAHEAKAKAETELAVAAKSLADNIEETSHLRAELADLKQNIAILKHELESSKTECRRMRDENTALKQKKAVAIAELERCASGFLAKPSKTVIERLKS